MSSMASHVAVLPILLPLLAGSALVVLHRAPLGVKRAVSMTATLLLALSVLGLGLAVEHQGLVVYQLGNWPSFAGIVLMADRLAILMLGLLVPLAFASQLFASGGEDGRGLHFHALFQFQLMGLCGAFLTGDIFNLFVFFEVLLAASYGLLLHGQGGERLRQGLHYVVLNLVASGLFLLAIALLYSVLGSLNMAEMSARIASAAPESLPLLKAGAWMLLIVFALKAALLPMYFWLPRTYASASASAAILFAIMTKLGVYSVVRVNGLLFGADAGALADLLLPVLFWAGAATATLAGLGAVAAYGLRRLLGYLVVGSAGVLFMAIGLGTDAGLAAGLYYLAHSTLSAAALFLLADWVRRHRDGGDALNRAAAMTRSAWLGGLFLLLAMAAAGLPPFGGFLGKSLLLAYAPPQGHVIVLWVVVLGSSLLNIVALARAGSRLFWQSPSAASGRDTAPPSVALPFGERLALLLLVFGLVAVAVMASDLSRYVAGSAAQLEQVPAYREAVIGRDPLPTTVPR